MTEPTDGAVQYFGSKPNWAETYFHRSTVYRQISAYSQTLILRLTQLDSLAHFK